MRIVVLGDFHLNEAELDWSAQCMDDIRECEPDLVVPLGDFGSNRLIGGPEGLRQSHELLSRIGKPLRAILGNHDLQRESGGKGQEHGTMERELIQLFGQSAGYGVIEEADFRLFFVSTDPQPDDSCYHVQECYVSEEQFSWLTAKLQERSGVPVIMFTHAPPIGCGLRTVPGVHVRATNAYLDQNHDALRWHRLLRETPEIVLWFSAHYHLGHGYPDSKTNRFGTTFFITGVHGSATRDGDRLSRVIDIAGDGVRVQTLDHRQRRILPEADWAFPGSALELVDAKRKALSQTQVQAEAADDSELPVCEAICPLGDGIPSASGMAHMGRDRWLVAASDGYLWEVSADAEAILGTLHLGSPVNSVAIGRGETAYTADAKLFRADTRDLWRFAREPVDMKSRRYTELEDGAACVAYDAAGVLWAAVGCGLYAMEAKREDGAYAPVSGQKLIHTFPEPIVRLKAHDSGMIASSGSGTLYGMKDGQWIVLERHAVCWDAYGKDYAAIIKDGDRYELACKTETAPGRHRATLQGELEGSEQTQIVCLGGGHVLLGDAGTAYLWNVTGNDRCAIPTKTNVIAMCAARAAEAGDGNSRFALVVAGDGGFIRPQLQVWRYDRLAPKA
ncbi:metallophosphoesterase family protein [Paenibacillus ginsengarvi]|uniref:Calcineurin-like phosphoesterase domain-containing protein n=1 Tax=Paenibacillus ginsengarvi TaxID=400777 RepID=A0A3B0CK42_9BACL|nr:metallophosphoesterase [Paenibacillus ginsengarvi]RKN84904.1 hypothetical protein D7M11_10250 [Paenibacillus ginsengarvi]